MLMICLKSWECSIMPDWLLIWKQYNDELVLVMTNTGSHSKEGSTSHLGLLPSGKKRETALRCSEPLRSKVGGPSKVYARLCGLGPPGENLT